MSRTALETRIADGRGTHRDFVICLADFLRSCRRGCVVFEEPSLSPDLRDFSSHPQPDVLTIGWKKHKGDQASTTIYEVKRTRSDYFASLNSGKWQQYLPYANRFFFATPAGLLKLDELPKDVGLMVYGSGWTTVRAATYMKDGGLSPADLTLLLHHKHRMALRVRNREERIISLKAALDSTPTGWDSRGHKHELVKRFGEEVAHRLQSLNDAEAAVESREQTVAALMAVLAEGFGLQVGASVADIRRAASATNAAGIGIRGGDILRATAYLLEDLADDKSPMLVRAKAEQLAETVADYVQERADKHSELNRASLEKSLDLLHGGDRSVRDTG